MFGVHGYGEHFINVYNTHSNTSTPAPALQHQHSSTPARAASISCNPAIWFNKAKRIKGDLRGFPDEMKKSDALNYEILGAPIGDPIFCAKSIVKNRANATN
eukprot:Em0024g147a